MLTLLAVLRRRWQGVGARQLLATLIRVGLASAVMAGAIVAALALAQRAGLGNLVALAGGTLAGALTYLAAGALLGMQELRWPLQILAKRRVLPD